MNRLNRTPLAGALVLLFALTGFAPAQVDLSGTWGPRFHEDQPERIPGPELADYLGLPINPEARQSALTWDASRLTLPEEQCRVHISPYIYRGPLELRIWDEREPESQKLIAIHQYIQNYEQFRTIWMDGRPHPPAWAKHTWMGFSTGKWEGDVLTVHTTHIKQGWVRRNGTPESDNATLTEHFIRHGDVLTHVSIVTDPAYLTEPLVKTQDFVLDLNFQGNWIYPCEPVEEVIRPMGEVPMYMPGTNDVVKELVARYPMIPADAFMGGAETEYPEYRQKLKTMAKSAAVPVVTPTGPEASGPVRPHSPTDGHLHVIPVQGDVYMLAGPDSNAAVQIGEQGALVVDTMPSALADELIAAVAKLTDKPIRYIVNTSYLPDHTGGNEKVRRAGVTITGANVTRDIGDAANGAALIAHEAVLDTMSADPSGGKGSLRPSGAWPTDSFVGNRKAIHFNGEPVEILHIPASTTDGSSMVWFRRADVIATGDIFVSDAYPYIDLAHGGGINGVLDGLNHILEITVPAHEEEGGTLVIPGRGRICDQADVVMYRDMITVIRNRVRNMIAKGMTLDQVKQARPTFDFDREYGRTTGSWTTDMFVEAVYKTLKK